MEFLSIFNPWHWWMLAGLLLAAELISPCAYFLALSVSSAIVGLAWMLSPGFPVAWQLGLFVLLSIFSLGFAHRYRLQRMNRPSRNNE